MNTEQRTDFPTSEEILEKTLEYRRKNFNRTLGEIEDSINRAMESGLFYILIDRYRVPDEVKEFLMEKGFAFPQSNNSISLAYTISWNPEDLNGK